jgi:hypothetical protein
MLTSVLSNSSFVSSVEEQPDYSNKSLTELPSISFPYSLKVSHVDHPDASNKVDVGLESQMAVRNFLLHFKCDSWMA